MLDAADLNLLRPHLATVEMVRGPVLGDLIDVLRR